MADRKPVPEQPFKPDDVVPTPWAEARASGATGTHYTA